MTHKLDKLTTALVLIVTAAFVIPPITWWRRLITEAYWVAEEICR